MVIFEFVAAFALFRGAKAVYEGMVVVGWTLTPPAIFVGTVLAVVGGYVFGYAVGKERQ
jgi:Sec-independent protein secretion pathway component TatC